MTLPRQLRTSSVPEKDEFYSALVERCVDTVVRTLGKEHIRALLMIGAPARSEVTVVETPEGLYSLSDIDLVCACRPGADLASLKRKLAPAMSDLNRDIEGVCAGADVALKSETQLAEPRPLISNFEMIRSPVVVWGDERIGSTLGDIDVADVQMTESLVLVHNRITEKLLVRLPDGTGAPSYVEALTSLYGTAKMVLDSITAYLFLRNNVPTSFVDRVDYFLGDVLERPESRRLKSNLAPYLEALPAWARFKTTGDLSGVVEHVGDGVSAGDIAALARNAWSRYTQYAELLWRAVLSDVARVDASERNLVQIGRIYQRLEKAPRSVGRAVRMLRGGRAPKGLFSARRTLLRSPLGSPRLLAYLTAVVTYLSYSDSVDWKTADRMIVRYCPFVLPRGYRALSPDAKRSAVTQQIRLLHHGVLLGRKAG